VEIDVNKSIVALGSLSDLEQEQFLRDTEQVYAKWLTPQLVDRVSAPTDAELERVPALTERGFAFQKRVFSLILSYSGFSLEIVSDRSEYPPGADAGGSRLRADHPLRVDWTKPPWVE